VSILVAVTDSKEGQAALGAAVAEAQTLGTDLVVVNLTLHAIELSNLPSGLSVRMVERKGPQDRDPVDTVLDEIRDDSTIGRLVIGVRRRTPVGKALLGSVSQRLLLEAEVPVLAVKVGV
jgi:nucleotide-binding universal stress UspA family protein